MSCATHVWMCFERSYHRFFLLFCWEREPEREPEREWERVYASVVCFAQLLFRFSLFSSISSSNRIFLLIFETYFLTFDVFNRMKKLKENHIILSLEK